MPDETLVTHSIAEAHFYLMATACPSCGQGPLEGEDARPVGASQCPLSESSREESEGVTVAITVTCGACRSVTSPTFRLPGELVRVPAGETTVVNPTDEPSRILDVGQWIMLFRMITERAAREPDKIQARYLGIEATQCLEEALKFYDEIDNDLPPPEALFTETSRARFRKAPEQFSRRRLIDLRAKLPSESAMRASLSVKKKRWWRRGREN